MYPGNNRPILAGVNESGQPGGMCVNAKRVVSIVAIALALGGLTSAASAEFFTLTDLGTVPAADNAEAFGITPDGTITGRSGTGTGQETGHAFRWTPSTPNGTTGSILDLGTLGGSNSTGAAINPSGQIAGRSDVAGDSYVHAILIAPGATITASSDLNTISNTNSQGFGINSIGQVVGQAEFVANGTTFHPFRTAPGAPITVASDLGTLGGASGYAFGINDSGQVVGFAETAGGNLVAFRYTDGPGMANLGTLGGATSIAQGINAAGDTVGDAALANGSLHAALWKGTGGPAIDLGALGAGTFADALAINTQGVIIGNSSLTSDPASVQHGFISQGGTMTDLNSLIPAGSGLTITQARALNDQDQIVGIATDTDGLTHAVLLTPTSVPEPSGLLLAGLGATVLLASARTRRGA